MLETQTQFFNRECSWVAFNRRVLEEALRGDNPLVERGRFLAICSSNLDEFFMVRVASVRRSVLRNGKKDAAGFTPQEQYDRLRAQVHKLVDDQYACWGDEVCPAFEKHAVNIVQADAWTPEDRASMRTYYLNQISPVVTPLAVDSSRPFPHLTGLKMHVVVELIPPAGDTRPSPLHAFVTVPSLKRVVELPGPGRFALLEDIVQCFLADLFPGYAIKAAAPFRLTRDAELDFDEEEADDLLMEIEEELRHRGRGAPVRLEVSESCSDSLLNWLVEKLAIADADVFTVNGPLDLTFLMGMGSAFAATDLEFAAFQPAITEDWSDPFALLQRQEILLHHPFDSFQPADL